MNESAVAGDASLPVHVRRRRILVVEDHADSGAELARSLAAHRIEALVVTTRAEAVRLLAESWDAIVSDIALPDGSGLEIGRKARALHPQLRLVALSGYGRPADVRASLDAGFDEHLVKPLPLDSLLRALDGSAPGPGTAHLHP
jgi:CheY-like chemotaxis protein